MNESIVDSLKFDDAGLLPAVIQHVDTNMVLMVGFMNREAVEYTLNEGKVCFWTRSRKKLWIKGETSGMFLKTRAVRVNCENNTLLVLAEPIGPTCHTGHESCFYREANGAGWTEIAPIVTPPEVLYSQK